MCSIYVNPLNPRFFSLQTTFSPHMPFTHLISISVQDRLRKHYSHLAEGWFLARKAAWSLSGCMATNSADYYMLVNEWVWSVTRLLIKAGSGHGFSFGVRAYAVRAWGGPPGTNHGLFKAKPSSHHVHSTLPVAPPTSPCPTLSADAEPARKHAETIFSAQCAV